MIGFSNLPIIGIIRGVADDDLPGTLQAALAGGLDTIEITLNTPNAIELIKEAAQWASSISPRQLTVGAGTVCSLTEAQAAVAAGASFIVSPLTDVPMINWCRQQAIPIFAGALTPTEVYRAWEAGASMVKVFPVGSVGGPQYIKELKGPFNEIKLLACGGVRPNNLKEYFEAGASAVAIGNSIFNNKWLLNGEVEKIRQASREYVEAYLSFRPLNGDSNS